MFKELLKETISVTERGYYFQLEFSHVKDLAKKRLGVPAGMPLGPALIVKYPNFKLAETFLYELIEELTDKMFKKYEQVSEIDRDEMYDFLYSYYYEDGSPMPPRVKKP
jgi:hypothetical protein